MKKKLMSLIMTVVLCLGMLTTVSAAPSPEGTVTQLPVPTNLGWSDNWNPQWDVVKEAYGHYKLEVYKDGEYFFSTSWSMGYWEDKTREEASFSPQIQESGSYTFRVAANNSYDPETLVASDFSDFSEAKVYTRPATALGTTIGYWDTENEGTFCYYGVENAGGYKLYFYEVDEEGNYWNRGASWSVGNTNYDTADNLHSVDMTDRIVEGGKYAVAIQALSADIATIANGVEGEKSAVFDTSVTAGKVEETLDNLDLTGDPNGSLETVKEEFSVDELRTAMQTDDEVLEKMKELDDAYAAVNGITVGNDVDPEVEALGVDASKIDMVGAALNTGAGNVTLEMKVTPEEEMVDVDTNRYKNSVQLDLKLNTENGYKSTLEVPITITMPVPAGLDISKLTILHYCQDGTQEVVHPKNNGDGTITFTVTKFSTFVFAEENTGSSGDSSGEVTEKAQIEEIVSAVTADGTVIAVSSIEEAVANGAVLTTAQQEAVEAMKNASDADIIKMIKELSGISVASVEAVTAGAYVAGPADGATVTFTIPNVVVGGHYLILHAAEDGMEVIFAKSVTDADYLTAKFDSFSPVWVVAYKPVATAIQSGNVTDVISPKTGDTSMYVVFMGAIALAGFAVVGRKFREVR